MSIEISGRSAAIDAQNPWPGLSAFDESAARFFNGRDAEAAELFRLVGQASLTVLFGKSGLGKSSLLQAGLFPRLREQHILPVFIRLDVRYRSAPLIDQTVAALQVEIAKHGVDAPAAAAGESLWEHLHGRDVAWWSRRNQSLTPMFVFDQFEEVFTLGAENADAIERLRLDLADLIENRIPAPLAHRIEAGASAEHLDLRSQRYKVLLSFREDFLPEVEGWKDELPSLMRNRLRLLPLSADHALQVVSGKTPAGTTHELVSDETARAIVRFVAAVQSGNEVTTQGRNVRRAETGPWEKLEIEPALLSLVCAGLNDKRKVKGLATIDATLLKETGESIIDDFYQRCVADVPDKTRRFIEDALITEGGFRNSYPLQDALDQGQLTESLLRQLVDRRLLRIDHQLGADRVELIHDRLTDVVREHRERERERLRVRRQRRMRWAAGSAALVFAAIGLVLFFLWQNAERAQQIAESERALAQEATQRALDSVREKEEANKLAHNEAQRADNEAGSAKAALRNAIAGKLVMQSRAIVDDPQLATLDIALMLAAAGYRLNPDNEAYGGLQYTLLATAKVMKIVGFSDPVIALSPDGKTAVTANRDDMLRAWNVATGQPRGALMSHPRGTESFGPRAAISPDGKTIASGSGDKTLRLWDAATGRPRDAYEQKSVAWAGHPVFSPDGKTLLFEEFANDHRTLHLLDTATGQPRGLPMEGHTDSIIVVAFSADGRSLVSGGDARTLRLWNAATGELRHEPYKDKAQALSIALSPDGETIATGSLDKVIRLWDATSGAARVGPLQGHTDGVLSVAFSNDGKTLASGGLDNTVRLWNTATGEPVGEPLKGHTNYVRVVAFGPDGKTVVSVSDDQTLRVWNSSGPSRNDPLRGHTAGVISVAFSPDGKTIASGSYDGTLRLWNAANGEPRSLPPQKSEGWVTAVTFNPDGKILVSGSVHGTLSLWDAATGNLRQVTPPGHKEGVTSIAFSPDGKTMVSASTDETLRLWNAGGQPQGNPLKGHTGTVTSVAFSPDGRTLASGGSDGTVRLWNRATGRPQGKPLEGHTGSVSDVKFSPDGKTLVSASLDDTLRLWDVASRQLRRSPMKGQTGGVQSVAFSPDGKILVSGGGDHTLRLWDAATGQPLGGPLKGHTEDIDTVAFSPDGRSMVSGSRDKTLRLWDAPVVWIDQVCAKLVRNLSRSEWKQYAGDIPYVKQCPNLPAPPG